MKKIFILFFFISSTILTYGQTAEEFFNKGNLAMNEPYDYKAAILDYSKAIELEPKYVSAFLNRGIAKLSLEEYNGALLDFNKVIEIRPEHDKVYIRRGFAKFQINDLEGAIADFIKAFELEPKLLTQDYGTDQKYADFYLVRGLAKIRLTQKDNGCLDISKAKNLGSEKANDFLKQYCIELNSESTKSSSQEIDKELAEFLAGPKLIIQESGVKVSEDKFSTGIPFAGTVDSKSDKRYYTQKELAALHKPVYIIGTPIKVGKFIVAQHEFPVKYIWKNAKAICATLGPGWRLPTKEELSILYLNKNKIANFTKYGYWSSSEGNQEGVAWFLDFYLNNQKPVIANKKSLWGVRAVKSQ